MTLNLEMLKKGSLDFSALRAEDFVKKTEGQPWGKTVHKVNVKNKSPKGYNFIAWNLLHPILKDKNGVKTDGSGCLLCIQT